MSVLLRVLERSGRAVIRIEQHFNKEQQRGNMVSRLPRVSYPNRHDLPPPLAAPNSVSLFSLVLSTEAEPSNNRPYRTGALSRRSLLMAIFMNFKRCLYLMSPSWTTQTATKTKFSKTYTSHSLAGALCYQIVALQNSTPSSRMIGSRESCSQSMRT